MKQLLTFTLFAGVAVCTSQVTNAAGLLDNLNASLRTPTEIVEDEFDAIVYEIESTKNTGVWTLGPGSDHRMRARPNLKNTGVWTLREANKGDQRKPNKK